MISHKQLFLQHLAQTTDSPLSLEIAKASGIHLISTQGKRYIDLISGISVSNTGHRPKRVINAIRKQLSKYLHTMVYGEYVQLPQVQLAKLLSDLLPSSLNSTYLVNSGSEAIEGALKLAKRATGRSKIVAMKNAYHGSTHGALSLMDNEYYSKPFHPLLPNVFFASFNHHVSIELIDNETACVVVEPVQGEAGYLPADKDFLTAIRKKCDETGTLLILDEIQTGMGRTGTLFAFQDYGIVPDILCLAKAFGGGMPLGAFVANREIMIKLSHDPILGHISTFGGHPLSCAAALENLKMLHTSNLIDSVQDKSALFIKSLEGHDIVQHISGKGLMLAVHLPSEEIVQNVIAHALDNGLITDWFLYDTRALRIAPPLTITEQEIKRACKILLKALDFAMLQNQTSIQQ